MKTRLLTLIAVLGLGSCTTDKFDINDVTPDNFTGIAGKISDGEDNPIEHIKVTISIDGYEPISAYTSSEGIFTISLEENMSGISQVNITIEDIDGDENGGHFASKTDTLQIDETTDRLRLSLDYRLTPATV